MIIFDEPVPLVVALAALPTGIAEAAVESYLNDELTDHECIERDNISDCGCNRMSTALSMAFVFRMSPEGFEYWNEIRDSLTHLEHKSL